MANLLVDAFLQKDESLFCRALLCRPEVVGRELPEGFDHPYMISFRR